MFTSPVLAVIIACEIGFWVLVAGGLALRYLLHRERASLVTLWLVPVLDLVLLAAVAVDLYGGADVRSVHTIAGLYLGASIAFGPRMVAWADARFAYFFAEGPKPAKPPKTGPEAVQYETRLFGLWLIAAVVTVAAVFLLAFTVADEGQRSDLFHAGPILGLVTAVWFISGPVWAVGKNITDKLSS